MTNQKTTVLITGANGEIGHGLIPYLAGKKTNYIIALDINPLDPELHQYTDEFIKGDILDKEHLKEIIDRNSFDTVFHLAALLSTTAEIYPEKAHLVNVEGTLNLLELTTNHMRSDKQVKFIFPSSVAVYGMPNLEIKNEMKTVRESDNNQPITMYGMNKLYCEHLGTYFSKYYKSLDEKKKNLIDFRCVRFPGIISALTVPTGGTSDYAPEMLHSAAQGQGYESFVREDTIIPFMAMPDAVKALTMLAEAPQEKLSQSVYNVTSFSATAEEIAKLVNQVYPDSAISYSPNEARQKIVDSWPQGLDDNKARNDWGWDADYDMQKTFNEYLIPVVKEKYSAS